MFAASYDFEKKSSFFSEKPIHVFTKPPKFVRFGKSYNFSRILRQIYYNLVIENIKDRTVGHSEVINLQTA